MKLELKEDLPRLRALFLLNKILSHKPKSKEELEVRNGVDMERHLGGVFLSEIGVFEGYESKRLPLQIVPYLSPINIFPIFFSLLLSWIKMD